MTQYAIVYLQDGSKLTVYDTAYTLSQAREASIRCYRRYGYARVVDSKHISPGDLIP